MKTMKRKCCNIYQCDNGVNRFHLSRFVNLFRLKMSAVSHSFHRFDGRWTQSLEQICHFSNGVDQFHFSRIRKLIFINNCKTFFYFHLARFSDLVQDEGQVLNNLPIWLNGQSIRFIRAILIIPLIILTENEVLTMDDLVGKWSKNAILSSAPIDSLFRPSFLLWAN